VGFFTMIDSSEATPSVLFDSERPGLVGGRPQSVAVLQHGQIWFTATKQRAGENCCKVVHLIGQ